LLACLATAFACTAHAQDSSEDAFRAATKWTVQVRTSISRPFVEDEMGSALGAGLVVDAGRGWILTNAHVSGHSFGHTMVAFMTGAPLPARRVYVDPHLDVAILAYDPSALEHAPPEPALDCSTFPPVGHPVGAFGHPWGFRFTGTRGITSAITTRLGPNMLQTDAPINAGNSGGPLISLDTGRVVGVNAAKITDEEVEGISFAVPMPYACTIIDLLKRGIDPSPPQRLVDFALDDDDEQTMIVARARLPAGTIDLRDGDQIVGVEGARRPALTESDLFDSLRGRLDQVRLTVLRDGRPTVLTGSWPAAPKITERRGLWISGALIAESEPLTAGLINGGPTLMIHHVEPGSDAEGASLSPFDLLVSADGRRVDSLDALQTLAAAAAKAHRSMNLTLLRLTGEVRVELFVYQRRSLPVSDIELIGPESHP